MNYIARNRLSRFDTDWITVGILFCFYWFFGETASPFKRLFVLNDLSISHPFAEQERVTDNVLYLIACIVPTVIIFYNVEPKHQRQGALLGLWLSLTITGLLTDVLKIWIGNPRPDFIARCAPSPDTPINSLVDSSVCTAPLGEVYLIDGMKSTPSGHSSIAFSGLGYLSLWGFTNYNAIHTYQKVFLCLPLLTASYIALSRTQDYRHHYFDIAFGMVIGLSITGLVYRRYLKKEEENKLPI